MEMLVRMIISMVYFSIEYTTAPSSTEFERKAGRLYS